VRGVGVTGGFLSPCGVDIGGDTPAGVERQGGRSAVIGGFLVPIGNGQGIAGKSSGNGWRAIEPEMFRGQSEVRDALCAGAFHLSFGGQLFLPGGLDFEVTGKRLLPGLLQGLSFNGGCV